MTNIISNNDRPKITITDIAHDSGVSPATVSLVLREKPGISPETRQRVFESALALGYIVAIPAPFTQPTINTLGLLMKVDPANDFSGHHFYVPVLAGIEAFCRQKQINLFYAHIPVDKNNNLLESPRLLHDQPADGLLIVGAWLDEAMLRVLQPHENPVVLVDAYAAIDEFDAVVTDNRSGAYRATSHLIEAGHREIAIVGSLPVSFPSIQERREGYVQAITDHQLTPHFIDCHLISDEAVPATTAYLAQHPEVTAVFSCNDTVAIDLIAALGQQNKRVPQDLSVIGFDNIALAQHITPGLTTMRVDKMGLGRLAAQMLVNRIENPDAGQTKTIIQPSLIQRQSVKNMGL